MTDKEKIRKEVERMHNLLPIMDGDNISVNYADRICTTLEMYIDSLQEEPISNDLEEAARNYPSAIRVASPQWESELENAFKAGAKWQKEQMEKNRIAHCDNITEEQYNLETGFLDGFLDKNKRMPTFLDAIEYGMSKAMEE